LAGVVVGAVPAAGAAVICAAVLVTVEDFDPDDPAHPVTANATAKASGAGAVLRADIGQHTVGSRWWSPGEPGGDPRPKVGPKLVER
jgi:hypothetical protein